MASKILLGCFTLQVKVAQAASEKEAKEAIPPVHASRRKPDRTTRQEQLRSGGWLPATVREAYLRLGELHTWEMLIANLREKYRNFLHCGKSLIERDCEGMPMTHNRHIPSKPVSQLARVDIPTISYLHSLAMMGMKRWEEAITALQRFMGLNDNPADRQMAYQNLGACYLALERFDEALAALDEVRRIRPDDPEAIVQSRVVAPAHHASLRPSRHLSFTRATGPS